MSTLYDSVSVLSIRDIYDSIQKVNVYQEQVSSKSYAVLISSLIGWDLEAVTPTGSTYSPYI